MEKTKSRKLLWVGILIVLAVVVGIMATNDTTNPSEEPTVTVSPVATTAPTEEPTEVPTVQPTELPADDVVVVDEDDTFATPAPVNIDMAKYQFSFSGELAEKVLYRQSADDPENNIEFYIVLSEQECVLFKLMFNQTEGDIVHMVTDAEGNKVPVAFVMNVLPEGLSQEDANQFYKAQGVVNAVIDTINAK